MRLTQSVEYALRAALYLAWHRERMVKLSEIAGAQNISAASLSQVLNWLVGKKIILSRSGYNGGYRMLKNPSEVNLRQVIEAAEGPIFRNNCLIHGDPCADEQNHWCPIHEVWDQAKRNFLKTLERYSLQELAGRVSRWNSVDNMLQEIFKR